MLMNKNTTALIILDGFGIRENKKANGPEEAGMPFYHSMLREYSHTQLEASHHFVGLPDGQMGTSEVGHLNMGAGRVYKQEIVRINDAIADGTFVKNPAFLDAAAHVAKKGNALHIFGLLSDGGIHSSMQHLFALIDLYANVSVPVYIHAFLDGRDTPPKSALVYLQQLEEKIRSYSHIHLSTLAGRYWAMDRDNRWDRIQKAYETLTGKGSLSYASYGEAIRDQYEQGVTDEFIPPCSIGSDPSQFVREGDAVVFFNFRVDRPRELTRAFVDQQFQGFERSAIQNLFFVTMVSYDESITGVHVAFDRQSLTNTLAEWLSKHGRTQFHTAETEKYAHVTHFFNGGVEKPFPGEDRELIPSPKVATYDLAPEMSAEAVKDAVLRALVSGTYDFLVVNFANPDMVGHTGNLEAVKKALGVIDNCLKEIVTFMKSRGMKGAITADHGNCERMAYDDGSPHTAHTTNLVPFILIDSAKPPLRKEGALCDVAPTILDIMGMEKPVEMTGRSLLME